jgi:DNA-directed RNA polymerase subunit RPC12/RpoP
VVIRGRVVDHGHDWSAAVRLCDPCLAAREEWIEVPCEDCRHKLVVSGRVYEEADTTRVKARRGLAEDLRAAGVTPICRRHALERRVTDEEILALARASVRPTAH